MGTENLAQFTPFSHCELRARLETLPSRILKGRSPVPRSGGVLIWNSQHKLRDLIRKSAELVKIDQIRVIRERKDGCTDSLFHFPRFCHKAPRPPPGHEGLSRDESPLAAAGVLRIRCETV